MGKFAAAAVFLELMKEEMFVNKRYLTTVKNNGQLAATLCRQCSSTNLVIHSCTSLTSGAGPFLRSPALAVILLIVDKCLTHVCSRC
jgi:hypothetical protein